MWVELENADGDVIHSHCTLFSRICILGHILPQLVISACLDWDERALLMEMCSVFSVIERFHSFFWIERAYIWKCTPCCLITTEQAHCLCWKVYWVRWDYVKAVCAFISLKYPNLSCSCYYFLPQLLWGSPVQHGIAKRLKPKWFLHSYHYYHWGDI